MTFATLGMAVLLAASPDSPTPEELTQAVADLASAEADRQDAGIAAAVRWGPAARSLLPVLLALKVEARQEVWPRDRYCDALQALAGSDEAAARRVVSRLAGIMADTKAEPWFREKAATTLCAFTPHLRHALPQLRAVLKSRQPGEEGKPVRTRAARLLARIGQDAVPDLVAALDDADCDCRSDVADVLGGLGDLARPAIASLTLHLKGEPSELRKSCGRAMARLDPSAVGKSATSVALSADPADEVCEPGFHPDDFLLRAFEPIITKAIEYSTPLDAGTTVPPVVGALQQMKRSQEARLFGCIGPHARGAVPLLRDWAAREDATALEASATLWLLLLDEKAADRLNAEAAKYGSDSETAWHPAVACLLGKDRSTEKRRRHELAVELLANLGASGRAPLYAWETLRRVWDDRPHARGGQLARALLQTAPYQNDPPMDDREQAVRRLREALEDKHNKYHDSILATVTEADRVASVGPLTPTIAKLLDGPHRLAAVKALAAHGEPSPEAAERLRRLLKGRRPQDERDDIQQALSRVDPDAIVDLPTDRRPADPSEADRLARLVPGRKSSIPLARELLLSPNQGTWETAARFLWQNDPTEAKRLNVPPVLVSTPKRQD